MKSSLSLPLFRAFLACFLLWRSIPAAAFEFGNNKLRGALDTTLSYGALWRVEPRDADLVGFVNGGRSFSVNSDDGNRNYDTGLVSAAVKVTNDLSLNYRNFSAFFRGSYFYDDETKTKSGLTPDQRDHAGRDAKLLDAYVQGAFKPFGHAWALRAGEQVVSWGESTFIQNGINVINPVDVTRLRVPGAELREALLPSSMIWSSLEISPRVNVEGFYLNEWDKVELDTCGTYFATSDVGCEESDRALTTGFGRQPEGSPNFTNRRVSDRDAKDHGQHGAAIHTLLPVLNDIEIGLYYMKYHSRVPFVSGISRNSLPPAFGFGQAPLFFFEYPENIELVGAGFNTELMDGLVLQGEYSHRRNQPLAIENFEVLSSAQYVPLSQLGAVTRPGQEVSGYRRHNVDQAQATLTKLFGPRNPFLADQWLGILEAGAVKVNGLPEPGVLRYEAPDTDLPGAAGITPLGIQRAGWPDDFSWGYVLSTNVTYNQVLSGLNVTPGISFSHDVNGTTPSPLGNFVESRKAFTFNIRTDYRNRVSTDVGYTRFYGAGNANLLHDRDFVSANVKYSF